MMLENMCEEQHACLLGRGLILYGNEVCHLVNQSTTTMMASKPL
jgi:hypothetical protein